MFFRILFALRVVGSRFIRSSLITYDRDVAWAL